MIAIRSTRVLIWSWLELNYEWIWGYNNIIYECDEERGSACECATADIESVGESDEVWWGE